jgi:HSP20 family protein
MTLMRRRQENIWDPFREMREISDRMAHFFESAELGKTEHALTGSDWAPSVNVSETDKAYLIKADLPEVKREDVKINHYNGVLTIEGERKQEKREENEKFHRVESSYGRFVRRFTLPEDAEAERIEAQYKDGALSVTIPKGPAKQPKARSIKIS